MKCIKQLLSSVIILSVLHSCRQQEPVCRLAWQEAVQLPQQQEPGTSGVAGPVAGVHNGVLIIAGGANFPDAMPWDGGRKKFYTAGYVYEKTGSGATRLLDTFQLNIPLGYAAVCSTGNGVLYAGGENEHGISDRVGLLQWDSGAKQVKELILPPLPLALANGMLAANEQMIYFAGGETTDSASAACWYMDMQEPGKGWQSMPSLPQPVSHAVMVWQGDADAPYISLFGGRKKNKEELTTWYNEVYRFDIKTMNWQQAGKLPYVLAAGTGVPADRYTVLLLGGDKGKIFQETESLILDINRETDEEKRKALLLKKNKLQAAHPGFSREVIIFDTRDNHYLLTDTLPFPAPVTTTALLWGETVIIPSGEIKAGVRTPLIQSATITRSKK